MGKQLRTLIVEDSENDALLLVGELVRGGYDVESERVDTQGAMAIALDGREWDIVLSDYVMPQFSGLAALKLLQEKGYDLPFIIVSGKIGEDVAVDAMKAGAHDYIMKDRLSRLLPAIGRELEEAEARREKKRAEQELRQRVDELERFRRATIQREFSMKGMKERLKALERELDALRGEDKKRMTA